MQFLIFIADYFENFCKIQTQTMSTSDKKASSKEGNNASKYALYPVVFILGN